jgi:hypothetical protein
MVWCLPFCRVQQRHISVIISKKQSFRNLGIPRVICAVKRTNAERVKKPAVKEKPLSEQAACVKKRLFLCCNSLVKSLDAAVNLAGTEAPRANAHLARFPVYDDMHALDVRRPATLGLTVGVADQIAGHDTLFADFTVFTHASSPPPC